MNENSEWEILIVILCEKCVYKNKRQSVIMYVRTYIITPAVKLLASVQDLRLQLNMLNVPFTISIFTVLSSTEVDGRTRGHNKMADVDGDTKQRMVVEFLTAEEISPEEIHARLKHVYESEAVDLACVRSWARRPGESDMGFRGRIVHRAVIQFLTAEGERPLEISQRLGRVYHTVPYSRCTVWRWAKRYLAGDSAVGDRFRQGRLPYKTSRLGSVNTTHESGSRR